MRPVTSLRFFTLQQGHLYASLLPSRFWCDNATLNINVYNNNNNNSVVEFVARNCAYFSRICSPIGRSAQFCSVLFKVPLRDLGGVNRRLAWQLYNRDTHCHIINVNV